LTGALGGMYPSSKFYYNEPCCPDTNPGLEPIRRTIEASVPTRVVPEEVKELTKQPADKTTYASQHRAFHEAFTSENASYMRPIKYTTSLDNPLFKLTAEEYRTLRRYQEEHTLPQRFVARSTAQDATLYAPNNASGNLGMGPRTTAQEYGRFRPNAHTAAYSYHGLDTKFTAKTTLHGNYRNHSLNL